MLGVCQVLVRREWGLSTPGNDDTGTHVCFWFYILRNPLMPHLLPHLLWLVVCRGMDDDIHEDPRRSIYIHVEAASLPCVLLSRSCFRRCVSAERAASRLLRGYLVGSKMVETAAEGRTCRCCPYTYLTALFRTGSIGPGHEDIVIRDSRSPPPYP